MSDSDTRRRRRTLPAGHVILVVVIGLGAATLLNAESLERTAETQLEQDSLRQRVALAFARPLASTAEFLQLTRPREELDDALGKREGAGFELSSPEDLPDPTKPSSELAAGSSTTTTLPAPTPVSPQDPLRVWVGGDSLAGEYSTALVRRANDTGAIETNRATEEVRVSTGLTRQDVFNWPAHLASSADQFGADVVVVVFGLNDDQTITLPDGSTAGFGSPEWQAEYRRRVGGMMDQQIGAGREIVFVGIPPIRDQGRSERYALINGIVEEEAAIRPRAAFVDTWDIVTDEDGDYADVIGDGSGGAVRVRTPDGIHLETGGAGFVADATMRELARFYDWTSWKNAPATTAASGGTP